MSNKQHGFIKMRSSQTNLLAFVDRIPKLVHDGNIAVVM